MRARVWLLIAMFCAYPVACSGTGETDPPAPPPQPPPDPEGPAVESEPVGELGPLDQGDIALGPQPQRLYVDELRASLKVVTNPNAPGDSVDDPDATRWQVKAYMPAGQTIYLNRIYQPLSGGFDKCWDDPEVSNGDYFICDGFHDKRFGRTLGRPDYYEVPDRSLAIDGTYAKLMRDMAWHVCLKMSEKDAGTADVAQNVLTPGFAIDEPPAPEKLIKNLRDLVLRFHGMDRDADDSVIIALQTLYDDIVQATAGGAGGGDSSMKNEYVEGWRGVCIALLEDPLFHLR